jgi:hypothetical protein
MRITTTATMIHMAKISFLSRSAIASSFFFLFGDDWRAT